MKIGILSMQRVINYGSVLQAYSLKNMLFQVGADEVDFLDIDWTGKFDTQMPTQDSDDYKSAPYLDKGKLQYFLYKCINKINKILIRKNIEQFQISELKLNENHNTEHFQLIVVGSDEVFLAKHYISPQLYGGIINANFIISYAAACGTAVIEGIPKDKLEYVRKLLSNYRMISVRDKHTADYISNLYDGEITYHMDPVLMGSLYKRVHNKVAHKNYLLIYAYGDRIRTRDEICAIKAFAKSHNLKIIAAGAPQYWVDMTLACSPFTLLDYFYNADYVVTDTYHGVAFSIINQCKFIVFVRKSNLHKMNGLLESLGVKDRLVLNSDDMERIIEMPIDYDYINKILNRERIRAIKYLRQGICLVSREKDDI